MAMVEVALLATRAPHPYARETTCRCSTPLRLLQVLNRAMPEKLNTEKKTITGRTFKR